MLAVRLEVTMKYSEFFEVLIMPKEQKDWLEFVGSEVLGQKYVPMRQSLKMEEEEPF